ncbi:MAG: putative CRISPR-associated protein, partial [Zestosphaera sp.]
SRFESVAVKYGVAEWVSMPLSDSRNAYPRGEVCLYANDRELVNSLLEFISLNPRGSCAELAGVLEIYGDLKTRYGRVDRVAVTLYSTSSCTSYLASRVIAEYLESQSVEVVVRVVESIRSEEEFDEGLASLVDAVAEDVSEYTKRGYGVYVNATPGFKPEVTFLVLAALLLGVRSVYYIHEAFRGVVRLPTIPVQVRESYLALLEKLVREGGVELSQAYNIMGLTEYYIRELEDRYLAYVDGNVVKPRRWVVELVRRLKH